MSLHNVYPLLPFLILSLLHSTLTIICDATCLAHTRMLFTTIIFILDPTVEESIECVFSHQLEDGEILFDMPFVEDASGVEESDDTYFTKGTPQHSTPSLLSSFFRSEAHPSSPDSNRGKDHHSLNDSLSDNDGTQKKMYNSAKLVHVSSVLDHSGHSDDIPDSKKQTRSIEQEPSWPEPEQHKTYKDSVINAMKGETETSSSFPPLSLPSYWPQRPLLLRATPGSGTIVKGIRFSSSKEYLSSGPQGWRKELFSLWNSKEGNSTTDDSQHEEVSCIPINNGNEEEGKALVVDFETPLFAGTILVRIRNSEGTTPENANQASGYFAGVNRQYQVVIQGRFRKEGIPMVECVTGHMFSHSITPPAPYIVRGALRVFKFFAPRLQAKLHGDQPIVLSPLGSTPQCISVDNSYGDEIYRANASIEAKQQEPCQNSRRLMPLSRDMAAASNVVRAKARKRAFDQLCSIDDKTITFDTNKVYTFEFLQHLVDFSEFEMSLGSVIGKYKLNNLLNGQPLTIMASHQTPFAQDERIQKHSIVVGGHIFHSIWSFELWHESLVEM